MEKRELLKAENLFFKYPGEDKYSLKNINLTINQGDFIAIIGQNGAGKTTLTKHFNGLYKPTEGKVYITGKDTFDMQLSQIIKFVGYCYQNPDHQLFCNTVRDEVAYGPKNLGISVEQMEKQIKEALRVTELEGKEDVYPFTLGRGERQRLAIASVIAMGSPILIVDEPTTGMDKKGIRNIMDLLRKWNSMGNTVVIITHDISIVAEYVPRTIVMADGQILADGSTRRILNNKELLAHAYVKQPQIMRIAKKLEKFDVPENIMTIKELADVITLRIKNKSLKEGVI